MNSIKKLKVGIVVDDINHLRQKKMYNVGLIRLSF